MDGAVSLFLVLFHLQLFPPSSFHLCTEIWTVSLKRRQIRRIGCLAMHGFSRNGIIVYMAIRTYIQQKIKVMKSLGGDLDETLQLFLF